jgi:hypothetical protein
VNGEKVIYKNTDGTCVDWLNELDKSSNDTRALELVIADTFSDTFNGCPFTNEVLSNHRRYYPFRCQSKGEMYECPLRKKREDVKDWGKEIKDCYLQYYRQKAGEE